MRRVLFSKVSDPFGCFSTFSRHPVRIDGLDWRTTEHYFQASKFVGVDDDHALAIRAVASPMAAARMGRRPKHSVRSDWESIKDDVMRRAVRSKVAQQDDVRAALVETGAAEIVLHNPRDAYWGDGGDGSGRNMLGRIFMEVRAELLDPERPWRRDSEAPLLDERATLRHDQYTPEIVCRAMGIASFVPPAASRATSARLLLTPSFSPEVCLTIMSDGDRSPGATIHALAEHLCAQQFPTLPAPCGVEQTRLDARLWRHLYECLTGGHEVPHDVVCTDGMSYHSAVRTESGTVLRRDHLGLDDAVGDVLRDVVPALLSTATEERCIGGLIGVAAHLGLTLDPPQRW